MNTMLRLAMVFCGCFAAAAVAEETVPETQGKPTTKAGNPFEYQRAADERGLVPATGANLPHGIRIAGMLVPKKGDAVAVLRLPGDETAAYVREGDLLTIHNETETPFYLLVKTVAETGVEVAPRKRPSEVHLIR